MTKKPEVSKLISLIDKRVDELKKKISKLRFAIDRNEKWFYRGKIKELTKIREEILKGSENGDVFPSRQNGDKDEDFTSSENPKKNKS